MGRGASARFPRRAQKRPWRCVAAAWLKQEKEWSLRGAFVGGVFLKRLPAQQSSRAGRRGRGRADEVALRSA